MMMASEKRRKKSPLADCTSTPTLSRPRRSCCSYASPPTTRQNSIIQSTQPNNPLIDPLTRSGNNHNQNEDHLKGKSSCPTSATVLPGVRSYQIPQCSEDSSQIKGVCREHREREGTSLHATYNCPTLGRGSLKSKHKTVKSSEPENQSKSSEDSLAVGGGSHDEIKKRLRVDINDKENFTTPESVLPALYNFQFLESHEDTGRRNTRVYSKRRERECSSSDSEVVSLSCSPLGRAVIKSKHKTAKSSEPENQSKSSEDLLAVGGGSHDEIKKCLRVDINDKENLTTPESVLPALYNFQFLESHEDTGRRNTRVYSKRRERECSSSDSEVVSLSCSPLGRAVIKSKQKTGRLHEAKNCSKNLEDSPTPGIIKHDQNEVSPNDNFICKENLSTPQSCVAAIDSFQFPDDTVDANFENIRVQSMLQGSKNRNFEKVSSSCPPLGRSVCKSHTGERCTELWKYSSLGARDDSPVSGIPKMKAQRKGNSLPVSKQKSTLPKKFIEEQRAHFAEIDAFALEEED